MDYPILLSGECAGTLRVTSDGLFTLFSASATFHPGLVRLSVYGGRKEGRLGVMLPEGDRLVLCRRLSRAGLAGFPEHIDYAAESGIAIEAVTRSDPEPIKTEAPEENPAPEEERDRIWVESFSGVLTSCDGDKILTALPCTLPRGTKGADIRTVGGREYIVFSRRK